MKKLLLIAVTIAGMGLQGCTTDAYTGQSKASSTAKGAGIGAVAGAGIGAGIQAIRGKNSKAIGKAALIGAGVGTVAGGSVGAYMDVQEKALRQELQGAGVQVQRDGDQIHLIMPGNITFKTNSSTVNQAFYPTLTAVAKVLKKYDKTMVNVVGHTDSTGTDATNNKLSKERAEAVAGYLIANQSLNKNRFAAWGEGKRQPIASNATADGREQNRRVEITIEAITK